MLFSKNILEDCPNYSGIFKSDSMGNYCQNCFEEGETQVYKDSRPRNEVRQKQKMHLSEPPVRKSQSDPPMTNSSVITRRPTECKRKYADFNQKRFMGMSTPHGYVLAVTRKGQQSDKLYALKIIMKDQLKEDNLLQTEQLEKMMTEDNPFLVKVIETFQDDKKIFILMEMMESGDLNYYRKQVGKFPEPVIRDIVAEVLEGIEFLHAHDIVYRTLKPENIMLTNEGHIKLTDYGFSKVIKGDAPRLTFSGSVEYMAPCVLQAKTGYNKSADLWTIGILLYQLKHGRTPFSGTNPEQVKTLIKKQSYTLDQSCSPDLKDLIKKLLNKEPSQRPNLQQIKSHPFFKEVDWEAVKQRKNPPPMRDYIGKYNIKFKEPSKKTQRPYDDVSTPKDYQPKLNEFSLEDKELK